MTEFEINVSRVEDFQATSDLTELELLFSKAQRAIVQGSAVLLVRENADGSTYKFDELTSETDLKTYKESVFKYL